MNLPTEVQIEAAMSDLKTHSAMRFEGQNEAHLEQCDYCQYLKELGNRNNKVEGKLCAIDNATSDLAESDPLIMMILLTPMGPKIIDLVTTTARFMFLLGMKAKEIELGEKELQALYNVPTPEK